MKSSKLMLPKILTEVHGQCKIVRLSGIVETDETFSSVIIVLPNTLLAEELKSLQKMGMGCGVYKTDTQPKKCFATKVNERDITGMQFCVRKFVKNTRRQTSKGVVSNASCLPSLNQKLCST